MEEGKRFSLLYLERKEPLRDSQRFRNRLATYFGEELNESNREIAKIIEMETGAIVPSYMSSYYMNDFFRENELRDVLDSITLIYKTVFSDRKKEAWKKFVTRVFREENLGYRLDSECGVHYFVDEEFERNRFSTLSMLDRTPYSGVRTAYEEAYKYMDNAPIDTKASVRSMFESIEILVKQMVETKNLNKHVVENALKKKCMSMYEVNKTASKVMSVMFDGFALWVDGLHNYRHGQADEEPVAPTEEMAIYVLSSGSAFLRWLVTINNHLNE